MLSVLDICLCTYNNAVYIKIIIMDIVNTLSGCTEVEM